MKTELTLLNHSHAGQSRHNNKSKNNSVLWKGIFKRIYIDVIITLKRTSILNCSQHKPRPHTHPSCLHGHAGIKKFVFQCRNIFQDQKKKILISTWPCNFLFEWRNEWQKLFECQRVFTLHKTNWVHYLHIKIYLSYLI